MKTDNSFTQSCKRPAKTVGYCVVELTEGFIVSGAVLTRKDARDYKNDLAASDPNDYYRIARVVLDK